jgi:fructokinase
MSERRGPVGTETLFAAPAEHLVVGEVLVDVVRPPGGPVEQHPGGSPGNVALGLARLGRAVRLVTELADDAHGALVRRHLTSAGVHLDLSLPVSGRTATATAVLDDRGSATYTFDLTWSLAHLRTMPTARHLHTGSIAVTLAPGADVVARVAGSAREHATVSFDPNIRPALVDDAAAVRGRVRRMLELADVVKVSDEDLAWLHPGQDPGSVAQEWLTLGPCLVVVTLGRGGSLAVTRSGVVHVDPILVDVVDTVGAGDSYMAALLDGLDSANLLGAARRAALRDAMVETVAPIVERAAEAAAITVSRAGAQPPTTAELAAATPVG